MKETMGIDFNPFNTFSFGKKNPTVGEVLDNEK